MLEVVRAVVQDKPRVEAGDQAERRPRRRIGHHDRTGTGYLPEVAQNARDEQIRVRPPEYSVGGRGSERRVHGEISLGLWFLSHAPGATNPREDLAQRVCCRTGVGEAGGLDEDGRIAGAGEEGGEGLVPLPEEIPPYTGEDHHRRLVHEGAPLRPIHQGVDAGGVWHGPSVVEAVEAEEAQDLDGSLQLVGTHVSTPPFQRRRRGVLPAQGGRASQPAVDASVEGLAQGAPYLRFHRKKEILYQLLLLHRLREVVLPSEREPGRYDGARMLEQENDRHSGEVRAHPAQEQIGPYVLDQTPPRDDAPVEPVGPGIPETAREREAGRLQEFLPPVVRPQVLFGPEVSERADLSRIERLEDVAIPPPVVDDLREPRGPAPPAPR